MCNVLITGCDKGIGLGLVREYLKKSDIHHVIATCLDPKTDDAGSFSLFGTKKDTETSELKEINDPRLHVIKMDVTCDKAIKKAVDEVSKIVGDCGLNILINNAGILDNYQTESEPDRKIITDTLVTNAISPVLVIQYFLPLLKRAAECSNVCRVINISSNLASITRDIAEGGSTKDGYLAYSMSKAAMNAMTKAMGTDLEGRGIVTAAFHPGHVRTDMGGQDAPTTIEESAFSLVKQFDQLTMKHSGGYYDRTGEPLPY